MDTFLEATGIAAISGIAVPAITVGVVNALGWTAGGVAAASTAAGIQAGIGSIAAGSAFAGLQSFAALGVGSAITTIGLPLAVIALIGFGASQLLGDQESDRFC